MNDPNPRGSEDRLYLLENRLEYHDLLRQVAAKSVASSNPMGLVAILRGEVEYLSRNLVNKGGFDLEDAYHTSWDVVWSGFESIFDVPSGVTCSKKAVVELVFEKELEIFRIDDSYRGKIDTPGVKNFYEHFGHLAMARYE